MTIVLDILILLVIGIGIWRGYKHGLVRTLIRLVGCILALVVAALLSRPWQRLFLMDFCRKI